MIGGAFRNDSSSLGNLNPASLKAFPKSLSLGKSRWQVLQEVPYCREKAGIAQLAGGSRRLARDAINAIDGLRLDCGIVITFHFTNGPNLIPHKWNICM